MAHRMERRFTTPTLWLALIGLSQCLSNVQGACPSPYYPTTHTACLNPSPYSTTPRGVGQADKVTIVSEHNRYRATVQATDMQMMYWDDELAFVAEKLAENCTFAHDPQRGILCKYSAGQNLALGYSSWASAIQGWYNETYKFTYGSSSYVFSDIGHYTQMMWNNTAKVGCGYSYCTNYNRFLYVCNYAPAGNVYPRISYPYTSGTKCSACPNRCTSSGLCDCGGLVCKNGGVLNINTCTCSCPSLYRGSADCNLNCSGAVDASYCNKNAPYGFPPSYCSKYSNVPVECPLMCGTCPGTMCTTLQSTSIAGTVTTAGSTPTVTSTTVTSATVTTRQTATAPTSTITPTRTATATSTIATTASTQRSPAGSSCPSPYYPTTHTACLNPSPYSTAPKGVGQADKVTIVAEHNRYRSMVQATDMQAMYWDDELAFVAEKLAENCTFAHDPQRGILCKYSAGQNLALGYSSWASAIQGWYNETYKFTYGSSSYVFSDIGHYTQMMWNNTAKVGCGYSYCTNYRRALFVCNYAPAGNVSPRISYPYTTGAKCSACPNRCTSSGLCDCGGLVCKNGGVLNLNSCTCSCPSLYRGSPDCNLNCTGAVDASYCNKSAPYGFPPSYCSMYSNVRVECPLMCGTCPGTVCTTLQSTNIASAVATAGSTSPAASTAITAQSSTPITTRASTRVTVPTSVSTTKPTTKPNTSVPTATRPATTTRASPTAVTTTQRATTPATTTKVAATPVTVVSTTTKAVSMTSSPTKLISTTRQTNAVPSTTKAVTATITATTTKAPTTTARQSQSESSCPSPYYPTTHTACLTPSPYSTAPKGVSLADQAVIVAEHNKYRALVQATDMQKMYWDEELAYVAQKLAENCTYAHDPQRSILCKYSAGQNLAQGFTSWAAAIQQWYNETYKFTYGSSSYTFLEIGHYTQIMWNNTAKVGCGYSYCTNYGRAIFVCNYASAGNLVTRIPYPYTRGTKCSACPNKCTASGLCDCGGLVCKNGGVLNIATCTCSCPSPYQGSADCNLNCTGAVDASICNKAAPMGYPPSYCSTYYTTVPLICPLMCGTCPGSACMALQSSSIAKSATTTAKPTTIKV